MKTGQFAERMENIVQRYLVLQKIVELGSFSRAAEFFGYTQSAVSQMIASLEKELSVKLLHRSRSGTSLTTEGMELYPYLERTLNQYLTFQEKVKEIRGLDSGIVRVGLYSSVCLHWMPTLLGKFRERYPGVEFIIHQGDYLSIQEWIRNGAVDFGFINPNVVDNFENIVLKEDPILAVLPEAHPLAIQKTVPMEMLLKEDYILVGSGRSSEYLDIFKTMGITPRIKYTIQDNFTILSMVEARLGVSLLTKLATRNTHYHVALRPTEPAVSRIIGIGYKDKESLPIAAKRFLELIQELVEELP